MNKKEVIVIGGGVAGMTSALYLSRAGISTTVFAGYDMGSLANTTFVENYPGIDSISGLDLVSNITEQARKYGAVIIEENISKIDNLNNTVYSDSEETYHYDALIIATGTKPRKIDAVNANRYEYKGIHYCATCDGALYKDKDVIVVGGGNTALTEALYLSEICKSVTIIIRRDEFRADKVLVDKINEHHIKVIKNNKIKEICGNDKINSIILENDTTLNTDAIFVAIGADKNDEMIKEVFGDEYEFTIPENVRIAGDIAEYHHQAVIAAGSGAKSAMDIIEYLNKN